MMVKYKVTFRDGETEEGMCGSIAFEDSGAILFFDEEGTMPSFITSVYMVKKIERVLESSKLEVAKFVPPPGGSG